MGLETVASCLQSQDGQSATSILKNKKTHPHTPTPHTGKGPGAVTPPPHKDRVPTLEHHTLQITRTLYLYVVSSHQYIH